MHCRSHSGAHSGFTSAPRGSGGTVHMNGRRSTRPSGSASDEDSARDCKPAGFAVSTPSGEGAAGDGGLLPKLSRRRFPSPFSLSRICSIGRWRHGGGLELRALPVSAVSFGGQFQISSGHRGDCLQSADFTTETPPLDTVHQHLFQLSASHRR
eukprot:scaffold16219_cov65-Phaeocystis_antarctica.AAC.7